MNAHEVSAATIIAAARASRLAALDERTAKTLLSLYGISSPVSLIADDAGDAERKAATLRGPFAVKVVAPEILHKSDAGGVALGLPDGRAVRTAIEEMSQKPRIAAAKEKRWLIEEMIPDGCEIVIGGFRDPEFGPLIMVGLGGIFVELLNDVAFRICPIDASEAREMLAELKGKALLEGARGTAAVDQNAIIDLMLRVGGDDGLLMSLSHEILEVDLNPVIVSSTTATVADARVILTQGTIKETPTLRRDGDVSSARDEFRPLFEPETVAVLGASAREVAIANTFIRRLKDFGFAGAIYPIHPTAPEIEGCPAYPSLAQTPKPVDYAYIAIGAQRIPEVLGEANGRCRMAQVISSGFGEVEEGRELQEQLVKQAQRAGVRVLGPNCLGTYSPRGKLTFPDDAPKELGTIGVVAQSGGLSTDIIKRGQWRGLRFSGLVTIGNSSDVSPHELVQYYLDDPQTNAIGLYLEQIRQGRAFFELLRSPKMNKPVVILRGGRSKQGSLAAASHTGALAGDDRAWQSLAMQTPTVLVSTVEEFIDTLLALQHLQLHQDRPTTSVTLFGNGGGSSVLGTDIFAAAGLDVSPFGPAARERLEALGLPPGTSVANPIDTPVRTLQEKDGWVAGEILDIVYEHAKPDAIAMHLNLAAFVGRGSVDPIDNLFAVIAQTLKARPGAAHFALALRTDGSPELDDRRRTYRERARACGVPVFDEIPPMAQALANLSHLERRLLALKR